MAKPITTPIRTCSTARTAVAHDRSSGAVSFTVPATATVTATASATFARIGIATELNAGAAAKSAQDAQERPEKLAEPTHQVGVADAQHRAHWRNA